MRQIALFIAVVGLASLGGGAAWAEPSGICGSEGPVSYLCGPRQPEDLYHIPGSDWVVTSSFGGAGGVYIINAKDRSTTALYPSPAADERFDRMTYKGCPGPPDAAEKAKFTTLGVSVGPEKNGARTLYAIRYPEAVVHVFELYLRKSRPSVAWVGCVEPPAKALLNSLVPLPGGGFIASEFFERGEGMTAGRAKALAGGITGDLWEWHPRKGWTKIPGGEGAGLNGIEMSKDGRWLYVSDWGRQSVFRLSRGATPPKRETVRLDFRPDNIRWGEDGGLLVAGNVEGRSNLVRIDPDTLAVTELIVRPDTPEFGRASVAVQVGAEIWLGSARGERIAIYPTPKGR